MKLILVVFCFLPSWTNFVKGFFVRALWIFCGNYFHVGCVFANILILSWSGGHEGSVLQFFFASVSRSDIFCTQPLHNLKVETSLNWSKFILFSGQQTQELEPFKTYCFRTLYWWFWQCKNKSSNTWPLKTSRAPLILKGCGQQPWMLALAGWRSKRWRGITLYLGF